MPEKPARNQKQLLAENEDLRARLDEALETLRAIRSSEVDALIVPGVGGEQVYTLKGADHPYRVLIEAMSEGALTLAMGGVILYANQSLAEMLKVPLEKVIGSSIQAWIAPGSQTILRSLLGKDVQKKRRDQLELTASDGSRVPVSLSVSNLFEHEIPVSFCLVATDLTGQKLSDEIKASEKLARELLAAANQSRRALLSVVEDQKRTQDALSASEAELRALFTAMTDAVIVYDSDGRYIKVAPTNPVNLIQKPGKLLGKCVHDILPQEQANQIITSIRKSLQLRTVIHTEYSLPIDGKETWFDASVSPLSENTVVWVAHDITERKHADKSILLQSTALNAAANAIMITNIDGTIEWINPAYSTLTGYTTEEVVGRNPRELVKSGKHAQDFYKQMWETILAGEIWFSTLINRRKDGSLYTEEQTITPLKNSDGKISHFIAIKQDITERKRSESKILESEERYRSLFMNMLNGLAYCQVLFDQEQAQDFIYLEVNDAFEKLTGFKDVVGKKVTEIIPGIREADPELFRIYGEVALTGKPASFEIYIASIGAWHSVSLYSPRKGYFVSIFEVITERKQRDEEIKTRNEELASLYQLSRILADADDLENVTELVVQHAAESLQTTFASIALLENDKLVMRGIYPVRDLEHGELNVNPQPIASLPYVMGALEKNEPVIPQAENTRISGSERALLLLDIVQSTCLVPLRVGSSLQIKNPALGLLILGESRGNERAPFTPEKIQLARSIGDQAATAIHRTQASGQASLRLQRIACLRDIDNTIAASFDLRLSLEVIFKHVIEQLGVDAVAVLVVNSGLQRLEYKGGRGFRSQAFEHMDQRLDEGLAGQAIRERRMIKIQDVAASGASFAQSELMKAEQFCVYIAIPLIVKGKANGVLEIYHRSPLDLDEEWFDFLNTLAGQTAIAINTDRMFYGLQRSNIELGLAYDATIEGWSQALDLRDKETEGHSLRVTEMTVKLAQSLNISNDKLKQIRWGALLHDIGKMGVPDSILLKPGSLTDEEWLVMKKHPSVAYEMLSPIQFLKAALDIPYCHHEKWDGTGYPRGLKGEQIPLVARIFAVVDVWDALISDRPYRKAWTKEKALELIRSEAGTHFDPQMVNLFLQEQR